MQSLKAMILLKRIKNEWQQEMEDVWTKEVILRREHLFYSCLKESNFFVILTRDINFFLLLPTLMSYFVSKPPFFCAEGIHVVVLDIQCKFGAHVIFAPN